MSSSPGYASTRRVFWHTDGGAPGWPGFWAVTRHDDIASARRTSNFREFPESWVVRMLLVRRGIGQLMHLRAVAVDDSVHDCPRLDKGVALLLRGGDQELVGALPGLKGSLDGDVEARAEDLRVGR
jgi:hypothetical protein